MASEARSQLNAVLDGPAGVNESSASVETVGASNNMLEQHECEKQAL